MDKLTAETITDDQIEQLMIEADAAGDVDQIDLCSAALGDRDNAHGEEVSVPPGEQVTARQRCADAINAARAQEDRITGPGPGHSPRLGKDARVTSRQSNRYPQPGDRQ